GRAADLLRGDAPPEPGARHHAEQRRAADQRPVRRGDSGRAPAAAALAGRCRGDRRPRAVRGGGASARGLVSCPKPIGPRSVWQKQATIKTLWWADSRYAWEPSVAIGPPGPLALGAPEPDNHAFPLASGRRPS